MKVLSKPFNEYMCAIPARDTAMGLVLLACRKQEPGTLASVAVYYSKQFGTDSFADLLLEDIEPFLTRKEKRWAWSVLHKQSDRQG